MNPVTTNQRDNDFPLYYYTRFAKRFSITIYPWHEKHSEGLQHLAIDLHQEAVFGDTEDEA